MKFHVEKLTAGYTPDSQTVHDISFEVDQSETLCLLGRNGVGKTTLLKAIMGLMPHMQGSVYLDDERISRCPTEQIAGAGIGYVPQGRRLFRELTVQENLKIGAYTRPHNRVDYERIFDLFPGLGDRIGQISGTLSGGEQQMLAMARALCLDPKILLLDEPTEGLMPTMVQTIAELVKHLMSTGVSVVMVEQRLDIVKLVASHICLMDSGSIVKTLSIEELPSNMETIHRTLSV
ncbi:MAG: ABC transporter ATP-binding protein [Gammaproteobacteria bacterium]|nr:ABC transporter ATP-binding protein [Gammaproteobacteria bacterium]